MTSFLGNPKPVVGPQTELNFDGRSKWGPQNRSPRSRLQTDQKWRGCVISEQWLPVFRGTEINRPHSAPLPVLRTRGRGPWSGWLFFFDYAHVQYKVGPLSRSTVFSPALFKLLFDPVDYPCIDTPEVFFSAGRNYYQQMHLPSHGTAMILFIPKSRRDYCTGKAYVLDSQLVLVPSGIQSERGQVRRSPCQFHTVPNSFSSVHRSAILSNAAPVSVTKTGRFLSLLCHWPNRTRQPNLRPILKGNNNHGRRGKRRCLQCRIWKQKVAPDPSFFLWLDIYW